MNVTAGDFIRALRDGAEAARTGSQSIGQFLDRLGKGNAWLVCLILTLPFVQPLPTGPMATIGGLAFAGIGWRLFRGDESLWLPERIRDTRPGLRTWRAFSGFGCWLLRCLSHVSRQDRLTSLADLLDRRGTAVLIVAGGLLVAVPFMVVPLQNSLPALIVFFACLGRLRRDGLMYLLAFVALVLTLVYFTLVIWVLFFAAEQSLAWLRGWLGK